MFCGDWDLVSNGIEVDSIDEVINLPIDYLRIKKLAIERNEDFSIEIKMLGESDEKFCYKQTGTHGTIQSHGTIVCSVYGERDLIIDHCCYVGCKEKYLCHEQKYQFEIMLRAYAIRIQQNLQYEVEVCKDCFINFVSNPFVLMGLNEREKQSILTKNLGDDLRQLVESRKVDNGKFHVRYGRNAFDILNVDKAQAPEWSGKIIIEYRKEYGYIPSEEERARISNFISFLLGKQLLSVCSMEYDSNMNLIRGDYYNAKTFDFDLKQICKESERPPINYREYKNRYVFINALELLLPKYLEVYETYHFIETFNYYWYAKMLSVDVNLPLAATVLERIMRCWFASKKSKTKGVLISSQEYNKLTEDLISKIEVKLGDYEYKQNIINRIKGCYNMSVRERFDIFFEEINLQVGDLERKALKERNIMTHGGSNCNDEELQKQLLVNGAYFVLLNRVILKIIGYKGDYIDYAAIGCPDKNISEVAGE
jgi:hypothetical protein